MTTSSDSSSLQQMDDLFTEFATLRRNFLFRIDALKAKRDAMLRELYQLTGDATVPSSVVTIEQATP
jgi:hypothetical protein